MYDVFLIASLIGASVLALFFSIIGTSGSIYVIRMAMKPEQRDGSLGATAVIVVFCLAFGYWLTSSVYWTLAG